MAGQSWAGIETVHTHCSQWTHSHTHTLPTVNSFLMSAGFPCPAGVDQGQGCGKGRGGFRGVHKLLKVWRNQTFFKSFLWYINMKAKPVRDERWDEMSWATWPGRHTSEEGGGVPKKETLLSLKLTCGLSAAAPTALLLLWQLWRLQVGNQFFFCSFTSSCCCSCCT